MRRFFALARELAPLAAFAMIALGGGQRWAP